MKHVIKNKYQQKNIGVRRKLKSDAYRMMFGTSVAWCISLMLSLHSVAAIEINFETTESGFFLKHNGQTKESDKRSYSKAHNLPNDSVLSLDRFTVVETARPVAVRASYGPFSTKQTAPSRFIAADNVVSKRDVINNTTATLLELQDATNARLDVSAHLVKSAIPQDSPVLRVLFHAGADTGSQKYCVLLHVSMGTEMPLKGRCMPNPEDGVCVAEVLIPLSWWPPLMPPGAVNHSSQTRKLPKRYVEAAFSVFEPPLRSPQYCDPKVQIQPLTTFAKVPLMPPEITFKPLRFDNLMTLMLPQQRLYPVSRLYIPVFLNQLDASQVAAFTLRARVKAGIRITGVFPSCEAWNISVERENAKHTMASVTAYQVRQENVGDEFANENTKAEVQDSLMDGIHVLTWLLEVVNDTNELVESVKVVWSVSYAFEQASSQKEDRSELRKDELSKQRLITKFDINKDDILSAIPIAKNWELINTAVLTGRQVAQPMKVFIVSQAGKVADVTLQSSCQIYDESVIKVSSSCSSVYVDGTEIRGSLNASVIFKYGTYMGVAKFIVWMPESKLEVWLADFRLGQIRSWKISDESFYSQNKFSLRKKRSVAWDVNNGRTNNRKPLDKTLCRIRYQQSSIEVYAKFSAADQNSGSVHYFISRSTALRITDLVKPLLRVADPKIATLKGNIIEGRTMGRTELQVLSPITGRVIGSKEIRVGSDKVTVTN